MKWWHHIVMALFVLGAAAWCTAADALARPREVRRGVASWYGERYRGRPMANGRPFDPAALTCAAWDWPLGTRLIVRANGREVCVEVTDRGPAKALRAKGRIIDLSRAAFAALADLYAGVVDVEVEVGDE